MVAQESNFFLLFLQGKEILKINYLSMARRINSQIFHNQYLISLKILNGVQNLLFILDILFIYNSLSDLELKKKILLLYSADTFNSK